MAKGPVGLGKEFKAEKKINLKFERKDYCAYEGTCREYLNISTLCWNCIWMEEFDVPAIIEENIKNGKYN